MKKFRVKFEGRQAKAIGINYNIRDTYKAESLGHMLYMLNIDYISIRFLDVYEDKSEAYKYRRPELINTKIVEATEIIKFDYPKREISPNTGTYRYTRDDAPDDYRW